MKDEFLERISANQALIHKVCRIYRNTREDREDLFQEIVYQLWKSYAQFRGEAKFSTWMYRISLNTALASFRKPTFIYDRNATVPDRSDHPEGDDREERLFDAIKMLEDGDKALIALYLEDMSYTEMADILGITENNVGVRINRIKKKIKQYLTR